MVNNEQMNQWIGLAAAIALPLVGGGIASTVTPPEILPGGWYTKIRKPRWTPPNWLFGPAWGVLYIAQGVASWFVWRKRDSKDVKLPLTLYGVQLALNLIWQPLFFKFHRPDVATADSAAVVAIGAAATAYMSKVAGPEVILPLMIPYLAWTSFATVLAGTIAHRNPNADKLQTTLKDTAGGKGAALTSKAGDPAKTVAAPGSAAGVAAKSLKSQ